MFLSSDVFWPVDWNGSGPRLYKSIRKVFTCFVCVDGLKHILALSVLTLKFGLISPKLRSPSPNPNPIFINPNLTNSI